MDDTEPRPQVTDEQLADWERMADVGLAATSTVRELIAEVRRLKARGLCEACGMNHELMRNGGWPELISKHERLLTKRDALQQRIDKALVLCDQASLNCALHTGFDGTLIGEHTAHCAGEAASALVAACAVRAALSGGDAS